MSDPYAWRSNMDIAPPDLAPRSPLAQLKPGPRPTGSDRVFDAAYGFLGGTPDKRSAASALAGLFDVGTLGMATGAYDGGAELARGGGPQALGMALMPGAKVVGPAGKVAGKAATEAAQGVKAYHVSPHDFDRFDISKVGSGIGSTTEGHGLYFTTSQKLADEYAKQMDNPTRYEVMINNANKKFLDYDELERAGMHNTITTPDFARASLKTNVGGLRAKNTGPGYEGTENFTVFDDSLIQILRKYGLMPPAVAGSAIAAQDGGEQ